MQLKEGTCGDKMDNKASTDQADASTPSPAVSPSKKLVHSFYPTEEDPNAATVGLDTSTSVGGVDGTVSYEPVKFQKDGQHESNGKHIMATSENNMKIPSIPSPHWTDGSTQDMLGPNASINNNNKPVAQDSSAAASGDANAGMSKEDAINQLLALCSR